MFWRHNCRLKYLIKQCANHQPWSKQDNIVWCYNCRTYNFPWVQRPWLCKAARSKFYDKTLINLVPQNPPWTFLHIWCSTVLDRQFGLVKYRHSPIQSINLASSDMSWWWIKLKVNDLFPLRLDFVWISSCIKIT